MRQDDRACAGGEYQQLGRTPRWLTMGASTPEATAMALVAEPMETRTAAASNQASTSGGM